MDQKPLQILDVRRDISLLCNRFLRHYQRTQNYRGKIYGHASNSSAEP